MIAYGPAVAYFLNFACLIKIQIINISYKLYFQGIFAIFINHPPTVILPTTSLIPLPLPVESPCITIRADDADIRDGTTRALASHFDSQLNADIIR